MDFEEKYKKYKEKYLELKKNSNYHFVPATIETIQWGFFYKDLEPIIKINSGDIVEIETLTHHAGDDYELMIKSDKNIEEIYKWTNNNKNINRRGAGDINSIKPGAGEGKGVHIITGPIWINDSEPGDILKVEILDIKPRACKNPDFKGRYFGSNLAASWGFHYNNLLDQSKKKEVITVYEIFPEKNKCTPIYNFKYKPQTDPYGIVHNTYDYPGIINNDKEKNFNIKPLNIDLRPHFGILGVTPNDKNFVNSIPPSLFGGNIDNWRAGKGSIIYLPIQVPGAKFVIGDSHACQGDSELCGTAVEFSMTGILKFSLIKKNKIIFNIDSPIIETPKEWIIQGFSYPDYLNQLGKDAQEEIFKKSSIDLAMKDACIKTNKFLIEFYDLTEDEAISVMSTAIDFGITQIVDGNYGVHSIIKKSIFDIK